MKKKVNLIAAIFTCVLLASCQAINKKIELGVQQEEQTLTKWINKSEKDLKIFFGKPDKIEFTTDRNRRYVYVTKKLTIKCERIFEINPNNVVIGFSSKNCF